MKTQGQQNGERKSILTTWHAPAPPDGLKSEPDHRVGMLCRQENIEIMILGHAGMAVKTIAQFTKLPESTVYYRLKLMGISVSTYRYGGGPAAALVFGKLTNAIAKRGIQQLRKKT